MEHYEQMEFDVTLDSERELKENINVAVEFACRQLMATKPPTVGSRQDRKSTRLNSSHPSSSRMPSSA